MAQQFDLFPAHPPTAPQNSRAAAPPGFTLVEHAIPPELEADLAPRIDAVPLEPFKFGQWTGKRLTFSFGTGYDFAHGRPAEAPPFPQWLDTLRDRLAPLVGIDGGQIAQALLIRYDPGAGIGWHRDRPIYGDVLGLSLSSPAILRLRRRTPTGFERCQVALPPRSLYRLSDEARWDWEHSIAPMDVARRSITLRTMRASS